MIRAADSMRSLNPADHPLRLTPEELSRLRRFAEEHPGIVARVLHELFRRAELTG